MGETAWLNEQLTPASINTSAIDAKVAQLPPINMAPVDRFNAYLATGREGGGPAAAARGADASGRVNENYGRELLELHTLGVGNYTETDVVNTARLLTGWSIDNATRAFKFKQAQNDPAPLTILGWTRPTTGNPFTHGVAFLQYLAMQPACAQFVCTELARRFVADRPDPTLVTTMVNAWMANDSQIAPVLNAMVAHSAFDASAAKKFRRPHDYITFGLRSLRASVNPSTNLNQIKKIGKQIDGSRLPQRPRRLRQVRARHRQPLVVVPRLHLHPDRRHHLTPVAPRRRLQTWRPPPEAQPTRRVR